VTIAEMRALLGLGPEVSDAAVVDAYVASISAAAPTPSVSVPPITLDAAKRHLGIIDDDTDDVLIQGLLASAVDHIERITGLVLSRRPIVEHLDALSTRGLKLYSWPVVSIDAVTYFDSDGVEQVLDPTLFRWTARRPVTILPIGTSAWPYARTERGAVTIAATAGFDGPEDVPPTVLQAIRVVLAEFYLNREAGALSAAAERSLDWLLNSFTPRML
jgi:uncharacterized phiE125 gp8 family phage protein